MRYFIALLTLVLLIPAVQAAKPVNPKNLNYAMGYRVGAGFNKVGFPLNPDSFVAGLKAGFDGSQPSISESKMQAALQGFQKQAAKEEKTELASMGKKNLLAGRKFLMKNSFAAGVRTLENGLQYRIIKSGTGKKPKASDVVTVNYEGKLIDGTVFDSSYKRGTPAKFKVNQVIAGWTQALQKMNVGAIWMLYIPAKLAYGVRGAGPIPPNSVLIFKVNLIKIN